MNRYIYTLNGQIVHPDGEWEITPEKNEGQIFFRNKMTGDFIFKGDSYETLMGFSECTELEFKIYCSQELLWTGKFKFPTDFEIDKDSCFAKGTPEVVDEYNCIMDNYDTQYHIIPIAGAVNPALNDCFGGVLVASTASSYRLFASQTLPMGAPYGYIDSIINDSAALNCGLNCYSSFMNEDVFANGDNYAAAYGTNNYVTGAGNRLDRIYLMNNHTLRTNALWGGTACDYPSSISMSFKELEELIRHAFNAYWFIDENGDFRIEHILYFDPDFAHSDYVNSPNLKTIISPNGKSFAHRKNKYSYETGELYDQEKWTWQHYEGTEAGVTHDPEFEGLPIWYGATQDTKSDCVPGVFKEKEHASPKFWTDIYWAYQLIALGAIDTLQCPGWLLFEHRTSPNSIWCYTAPIGPSLVINGYLATSSLQANYHTYDRIFETGYLNGNLVTFDTWKPIKLQDEISFPVCCNDEPDPMNRFVTEMGNGKVKSMSRNKTTIKVELLY